MDAAEPSASEQMDPGTDTGTALSEAAAGQIVDRWTARNPAVILALLLVGTPVYTRLPVEAGVVVFALGTVTTGMAHGAVDHLVPLRAASVPLDRSLSVVTAVYAVLGAMVVVGWWVAPAVAFVTFVLLTWLHWGQGDVFALRLGGAAHLQSRAERALTVLVRGGLPMAVPLVSFPGEFRLVAEATVGLFGVGSAALDPIFASSTRTAVVTGMAAATLVTLSAGLWRVSRGAPRSGLDRDAAELTVLWLWFWFVPPVLAIGVYFALWHAPRHIGRLMLVDTESTAALSAGDARTAIHRFLRDAAPLTLGGYLVVIAVGLAVPAGVVTPLDLLGVALVGIAALTLPHVAIVGWLDRKQGIW
ncbi:MAG: beta-carotene 15,15''-monooxygenase, Brp/Blh family [uncultured archaeon A07HR60]|nr:MAG: beta-carotene 15,15''-monooxygenase, Brp/Blh family [uncultured archaeon A07HR60]